MTANQTRAKKRLGAFLHETRERSGRTVAEVAELLRVSESTISRYESGHVRPAWQSLQALLPFYGATDSRADAAVLWEDAGERAARIDLPPGTPKPYRSFVRTEGDATTERTLQPITVPGILQTADYTRAINETGHYFRDPAVPVEQFIAARSNRKKRLQGPNPLRLHAVMDESVILRVVGGAKTMHEQLDHLLTMSKSDHVTIQVVPFGMGCYGTMSGGCTILGFDDPDDAPLVYMEHIAGGVTVENPYDVQRFETMFADIAAAAASPDESRKLIEKQLEELGEA